MSNTWQSPPFRQKKHRGSVAKNGVTVFRERVIQMSRNQPGHVQIMGCRLLGQSMFYAFQKRATFSSNLNKQDTIKSQNDTSHYSDEKHCGAELTTTRVMLSTKVPLVRTTPWTALPVLAWPEDNLWARCG